jgi:nucleolin
MSSKLKNTKVDKLLSDDSSDDAPVTKNNKAGKRKPSVASENSGSVNLLKNKRKPSKEVKKVAAKKNDSDSDSEEVKPKKQPVKKAVAKKDESDSDSDAPKKTKAKATTKPAAKKVDSDDESDSPKKVTKKPVSTKKVDSDDESDEKPKKTNGNGKSAPKKQDSDSEDDVKVHKPNNKNGKPQQEDEDEDGHKEVFIKNLNYQSTEDSVREAFSALGNVVNVKLLTDRMTGKPKGIGFVEFEKRSDAKKALEGVDCDGRQIQCSWSNEKKEGGNAPARQNNFGGNNNFRQGGGSGGDAHTIFVGNLGFKTSEQQVKKFFSSVGNVVGVRIATHEDGKRKGFCHVDFDSSDAAQAAVGLAGQELDGRELRVDVSTPRQGGGRDGGDRGRGRGGFRGGRGGNRGGPPREYHAPMGSTGTKKKFNNDSDDE